MLPLQMPYRTHVHIEPCWSDSIKAVESEPINRQICRRNTFRFSSRSQLKWIKSQNRIRFNYTSMIIAFLAALLFVLFILLSICKHRLRFETAKLGQKSDWREYIGFSVLATFRDTWVYFLFLNCNASDEINLVRCLHTATHWRMHTNKIPTKWWCAASIIDTVNGWRRNCTRP